MENHATEESKESLLSISLKLRGLAHLIESQRADIDPPDDLTDVHWGLGRLLTELSQAVGRFSRQIQEDEIQKSRRSPK